MDEDKLTKEEEDEEKKYGGDKPAKGGNKGEKTEKGAKKDKDN